MNLNLAGSSNSNPVHYVEVLPNCTRKITHLVQRFADRFCLICSKTCVQRLLDFEITEDSENPPFTRILTTEEALMHLFDIQEDVYYSLPRNKKSTDYWAILCNNCTEQVHYYVEMKLWNVEECEIIKRNLKSLAFSAMEFKRLIKCPTWEILCEPVFTGFTFEIDSTPPKTLKKFKPTVGRDWVNKLEGMRVQDEASQVLAASNEAVSVKDDHDDTIMTSRGEQKFEHYCIFCCAKSDINQLPSKTVCTEKNLSELLNIKPEILDKLRSLPNFGPEYWASLCCTRCNSFVKKYLKIKAIGSPQVEVMKNLMKAFIFQSIKEKEEGSNCPIWKQIREDALIGFQFSSVSPVLT